MTNIAQQDNIVIKTVLDTTGARFPIVKLRDAMQVLSLIDRPMSALAILLISSDEKNFYPVLTLTGAVVNFLTFSVSRVQYSALGTDTNIEGLAAIQDNMSDEDMIIPRLRRESATGYLRFLWKDNVYIYVTVDGKYVNVTLNEQDDSIESLSVSDVAIPEGVAFSDISEDDLMKLIGAPRVS